MRVRFVENSVELLETRIEHVELVVLALHAPTAAALACHVCALHIERLRSLAVPNSDYEDEAPLVALVQQLLNVIDAYLQIVQIR
jgi:ABC-type proline/glycine betaine transport system permease subunit